MAWSRDYQAAILDAVKANTLKLHLYSDDPTVSDTGTEITLGSYVAQTVTFGANSVVGSGTQCTNDTLVSFPQATADWDAPITHFGIRISGGILVQSGSITELGVDTSRQVRTGDIFRVPISVLVLRQND